MAEPARYPAIGSLGAIGDGRSLALVGPNAAVEWFCPVRFDALPLVWPLLDRVRDGHLQVGPLEDASSTVRYAGETAVLEFDWHGARGRAVGQMCMGWPEQADGQQCVLWVVRGLADEIDLEVRFAPRPAFGREQFELRPCESGVELHVPSGRLAFTSSIPVRLLKDEVEGRARLRAGESLVCCLSAPLQRGASPHAVSPEAAAAMVEQTAHEWRRWASSIQWEGAYREVRDRPRHFVYSKAMAWVALDRACRIARTFRLEANVERWAREAEALCREVLARGLVPGQGHLGRSYGEDALDASLLLLPFVGFLDANDPVPIATIRAVRQQLSLELVDGRRARELVRRSREIHAIVSR